jgi:cytochrome c oxidase subunit 3
MNAQQQHHAARLAMWLFLGSELLLFAGLFALYTAYRVEYPAQFISGIEHDALALGSTNTVVLIVSSFTVAWAVHSMREDRRRTTLLALGVTMLLGVTFLVLKGIEYSEHFADGIYPGYDVFFTLYYFMTGLHAIHMIAGLVVMTWLVQRVRHRRITAERHLALELGALYWHLVDCVWIVLWPLFYLAR